MERVLTKERVIYSILEKKRQRLQSAIALILLKQSQLLVKKKTSISAKLFKNKDVFATSMMSKQRMATFSKCLE